MGLVERVTPLTAAPELEWHENHSVLYPLDSRLPTGFFQGRIGWAGGGAGGGGGGSPVKKHKQKDKKKKKNRNTSDP